MEKQDKAPSSNRRTVLQTYTKVIAGNLLFSLLLTVIVPNLNCTDLGPDAPGEKADVVISPAWYRDGELVEKPEMPQGAVVHMSIASPQLEDTVRSSFEYGATPDRIDELPVGIPAFFIISVELPDGEVLFAGEKQIFETVSRTEVPIELHQAPPRAPAQLEGKATGMGVISLSWNDNSSQEQGYVIQRMITGEATYTERAVLDPDQTSFLDTVVYEGTVSYQLFAFNEAGRSTPALEATVEFTSGPVYAAVRDTFSVREDSSFEFSKQALFSNDLLFNPSSLTLELDSSFCRGTLNQIVKDLFKYQSAEDFFGWDTLKYRILLNDTLRTEALVLIEVLPENDAPAAQTDTTYSVKEDSVLTVLSSSGLLSNDHDPDYPGRKGYDVLEVDTGSVQVEDGELQVQPDGGFTYTPPSGFSGRIEFTYKVTDETGLESEPALVRITVTKKDNYEPVALGDEFEMLEDDTLKEGSVITNDTDENGIETVSVVLVESTRNGQLQLEEDGIFHYVPDTDFFGHDTFSYKLRDDQGAYSQSAVVRITVKNVNDPPVAENVSIISAEDSLITIDLTDYIHDPDVEDLMVESVSNGRHGSAGLITGRKEISYKPDSNFFGLDTITYSVSDADGESASAQVAVVVQPRPDAPYFLSRGQVFNVYEGDLLEDTVGADDPDNTFPQVKIANVAAIPAWLSADQITGGLVLSGTPPHSLSSGEPVVYTFYLSASDDNLSVFDTVHVRVLNVNLKPEVAFTNLTDGELFQENTTVSIEVNADDADGTISKVMLYSNGKLIGEKSSSPYVFSLTEVPYGTYDLSAAAVDDFNDTSVTELQIKSARWTTHEIQNYSFLYRLRPVEDRDGRLHLIASTSRGAHYVRRAGPYGWTNLQGLVVDNESAVLQPHVEVAAMAFNQQNVAHCAVICDSGKTIIMKEYNGSDWTAVADSIVLVDTAARFCDINLAFTPNNTPLLSVIEVISHRRAVEQVPRLYSLVSGKWVRESLAQFFGDEPEMDMYSPDLILSLENHGNDVMMVTRHSSPYVVTVFELSSTGWRNVAEVGNANIFSIFKNDTGKPYVAFTDYSNTFLGNQDEPWLFVRTGESNTVRGMFFDSTILMAEWQDDVYTTNSNLIVQRHNGTDWEGFPKGNTVEFVTGFSWSDGYFYDLKIGGKDCPYVAMISNSKTDEYAMHFTEFAVRLWTLDEPE